MYILFSEKRYDKALHALCKYDVEYQRVLVITLVYKSDNLLQFWDFRLCQSAYLPQKI